MWGMPLVVMPEQSARPEDAPRTECGTASVPVRLPPLQGLSPAAAAGSGPQPAVQCQQSCCLLHPTQPFGLYIVLSVACSIESLQDLDPQGPFYPQSCTARLPAHQHEGASLEKWCDGGWQRHLPGFIHDHDVKHMPQQHWRVHAQRRGAHLRQVATDQDDANMTWSYHVQAEQQVERVHSGVAPHHPGAACEAAQLCHGGIRPQAPAGQAVPQRTMHRVSTPQPQHRQTRGS
jgi:hypothetical protein